MRFIAKTFGLLLVLFGLLIARSALRSTPGLEDLVHWEGTIATVSEESVSVHREPRAMLRITLEEPTPAGEERVFFVHPGTADTTAIAPQLQPGAALSAWVEPHARQILAGTPLARGRTEAWQLVLRADSSPDASPLLAFRDSAARRRRERAGWGLSAGVALLVGLFGLTHAWRGPGSKSSQTT